MGQHRVTRIQYIALLLFAIGGSAQAACLVKPDAVGANNGSTWADAYTNLQSALLSTACSEVWVASGTYLPGAARSDSFVVRPGSAVYGGFIGNESVREARDPITHITTLSGDIGTPGDNSDNSYHVVTMDGTTAAGAITASTVLDGFTIRDGNASAGIPDNMGAGLYCVGNVTGRSCDPTLSQLHFVAHSAIYGAAIALRADGFGRASPQLSDVVFSGNTASRLGGAIYVWAELNGIASPKIERATFSANKADQGGAIYNSSGNQGGTANATILNTTFQGNDASLGTSIGNGGAIYNAGVGGTSAMVLTNVTFSGNTATGLNHFGGAIANIGVGATPTITNAIFHGNQANQFPEFFNTNNAQPTIRASIVQGGCPTGAICTDVQNTDPLLGALANNGGFGQTMLLGTGSAAIDSGDDALCPTTDQRGVPRPQGVACDIGAVEVALPHVCYVNRTAAGANHGFSWADAYVNLQSALRDTSCSEVWVAKGVYKPTDGTDRNMSFWIRPGLKVLGGFIGIETSSAEADPGAHRTVLSGDLDNNDVTDADGVTRSHADAVGNNTYTIVQIAGNTAAGSIEIDTVLDGFAISGGTGLAGHINASIAGALYCDGNAPGRSCSPLLSRLWFAGNSAEIGGAIFLRGENGGRSNPLLRDVTFSGNFARSRGGAIYNYGFDGEASPELENVTFSDNVAELGTIFNQAGPSRGATHAVLRNVTFANNQSQGSTASAIVSFAFDGGSASIDVDDSIFWGATSGTEIGFFDGNGTAQVRNSVMRGGCPGGQVTCENVVSADPLLGTLQNNGGSTPTALPGVGSSALDAADPASCGTAPVEVDQRGVARPQGPACDIGAVELLQNQFVVGVSGPGSVTADPVAGSPPASDGIVACDEKGEHCIAGYAAEPTPASVVLDLTPNAHAHIESVHDICGPAGSSIGVLQGNTYSISTLDTDCAVLAIFALDEHTVGGQVNGLVGSGLSLQLNAEETLSIASDGAFTFDTLIPHGESYAVTIAGSPSQPTQTCTITNGNGTIDGSDVTNIVVNCATNTYTIGGTVAGLLGNGFVLQLGGETLPISSDGAFVFSTAIASGNNYSVTVAAAPSQPTQVCSIEDGSGTVTNADITDVAVNCQIPVPRLVLTFDNDRDYLRYGRMTDYVVTLRNDGEGTASNVNVSSAFSSAFDLAFAQWQCLGAGSGASCTPAGTGALSDTVTLPPDRSVSWLVSAPVLGEAVEPDASFTVTVAGAMPESITDTDILVILRDGFDVPYSDGTHVGEAKSRAILEGDASHAFAITPPGSQRFDDLLHLHAQGTEVRVQRTTLSADVSLIRLLLRERDSVERVSPWSDAPQEALLMIGSVSAQDGERVLLLEGARAPLILNHRNDGR